MLDPEFAERRSVADGHVGLQRRQDRADPVPGVQAAEIGQAQQLLAGEDEIGEGQATRQLRGFLADELDMAAAAARLRIPRVAEQGRALGQLGGELGLETGAAMAEQGVDAHGEGRRERPP